MPPIEPNISVEKDFPTSTTAKSIVGIIYPPPEVRNIVDKTASFVARNGFEFENRIRQNELNNPKFNFLNSADPYHAYYQHKVKEFQEGRGQEPIAPKSSLGLGLSVQKPLERIVEQIIPKEPPPENEFIVDPPSIAAMDLDIVKLTAQFVARNGRSFLTNLMNREQRNYQFDFLRPQHSLFNYFTKLVEQYTKIMIPPKDLLPKLRKDCDNPNRILDQAKYRVEWQKFQQREKQKEEEEREKERVAYAQIDWHDFVVVETVDFQPTEMGNLPPPTTPAEVGARVLAQERFETSNIPAAMKEFDFEDEAMEVESEGEEEEEESSEKKKKSAEKEKKPGFGADITVQDMEEGSDEESGEEEEHARAPPPPPPQKTIDRPAAPLPPPPPPLPPKDVPQPPPLPPTPDSVIIKEYNPKAVKMAEPGGSSDKFLVSPITGERIPADKMAEHLRIGLLDPNWIAQRDRAIQDKREQEEVYAPGGAIENMLKQLAERRTDIFGPSHDEAEIGKKIGEEEDESRVDKVIWDGHSGSMEKISQKARENISIEDQIKVIHKVKGLLDDEDKDKIGPSYGSGASSLPKPPVLATPSARPPLPPRPPVPTLPAPVMPAQGMMVMPPVNPPIAIRPMVAMPLPPRPPIIPHLPPMPPAIAIAPPVKPPARPMDDEPPSKKSKILKTEEHLIPEATFLAQHPEGMVTFKVSVPSLQDKPEWKCNGQMLNFTMPLTDAVSVIKVKLHEASSVPVGKQKLQLEGMFIKDSNTLAFYNITKDCIVQMQIKERGGRKK